jgi:hypothetical protein
VYLGRNLAPVFVAGVGYSSDTSVNFIDSGALAGAFNRILVYLLTGDE